MYQLKIEYKSQQVWHSTEWKIFKAKNNYKNEKHPFLKSINKSKHLPTHDMFNLYHGAILHDLMEANMLNFKKEVALNVYSCNSMRFIYFLLLGN